MKRNVTRVIATVTLLASFALCDALWAKVGFRQLTTVHPVAVQRGTESQVQVRSNFTLDHSYATFFDRPGIRMTYAETEPIEAPRKSRAAAGTPFRFDVAVPDNQPTGVYEMRVATRQAVSSVSHLLVTDYPVVVETTTGNDDPKVAQQVPLPAAVCGVCESDQDVDCFRFYGTKGQRITAEVFAQRTTECVHIMVSKHPIYHMNPILTLLGPNGQVVAENDNYFGGDSFLNCELPETGDYVVRIRDVRYAGSEKFTYCVELSDRPYLKAMFPLAVQAGTTVDAKPIGFGRGLENSPAVKLTSDPEWNKDEVPATTSWRPIRYETTSGATNEVPLLTSPHRQYTIGTGSDSLETAAAIEFPCGVNGRIAQADAAQYFAFDATKGQVYLFAVEAQRHGLPLDSVVEVFGESGELLAEADDTPGSMYARSWSDKDSQLRFTAPADGRFYVSVRDLNGRGGEHFVYYLRADVDGPDFELYGEYYYAMLAPGTRMLWFAGIRRLNGFDGPVTLGIEGLPSGVELTPATIPAGMNHCALILTAAADAEINANLVRVYGKAKVTRAADLEHEIVRYGRVTCELQQGGGSAQIRWPCKTQIVGVTEPLDLIQVEATPNEISLEPGGRAEIKIRVLRQEGNTDPITLAMSHMYYTNSSGYQLPPGVTLSSDSRTQLKGDQTESVIVIEASKDAMHVSKLPIAVMARVYVSYNISTNYASTPISLTVTKSAGTR
jgi:hypothetical protein